MSFPVTLNGTTYTLADFTGTSYVDGFPSALEDFVTHAGAIYASTSTTSNAIGTGSKTFAVPALKPYQPGTPLRIADAAAVTTNWIDAIVTSYSGTSLVVTSVAFAGSGTKSSWKINIGGGPIAYTGTLPIAQGGSGATSATAAASNLGVGTEDSPTFSDATLLTSDGGVLNLQTSEATIVDGDVLGALKFNAPSEADGADGDARLLGAAIEAVAEGTFSDTNNATELVFKTGASEAATTKMVLNSGGNLDVSGNVRINGDSGTLFFNRNTSAADIARIQYVHGNPSFDIGADGKNIRFVNASNFAETVRFGATGDVTIQDGNLIVASGHGIDFSAQTQSSSSTASELLNHYEEGTWAPVFQGSSGSGAYSFTAGAAARYTRVGNLVTVSATLQNITEGTGMGGYVQIAGLPFTKPAQTYGNGSVGLSQWNVGFEVLAPIIEPITYGGSTTTVYIHLHRNNAGSSNLLISMLTDETSDIVFTFTYQV